MAANPRENGSKGGQERGAPGTRGPSLQITGSDPSLWCDYCERSDQGTDECTITDHEHYDETYGGCPWTSADECAMAAEREVAGTDAAPTVCGEHA